MIVNYIKFKQEFKILVLFAFLMNIDIFYLLFPFVKETYQNMGPDIFSLISKYSDNLLNALVSFLSTIFFGAFFFTLYLYLLVKQFKSVSIFLIVLLIGFSLTILSSSLHYYYFPELESNQNEIISRFRLFVWYSARAIYMALISTYVANLLFTKERESMQQKTLNELIEEDYKCRYGMLHEQIKPHFLFNSINTLNAIIDKDQIKARFFVNKLSNLLSYSLTEKELSTYEKEIEIAKAYSYLMKIRFENSLDFEFKTSNLQNKALPIFSLQVLLENAVKHNVFTEKEPITVTIETLDDNYIQVSNPFRKKTVLYETSGIGLHNLAQRYHLLAKKEINISSDGKTFKVIIPLLDI